MDHLTLAARDYRDLVVVEWHEAGHGTVAVALGLPLARVEVGRVRDHGFTDLGRPVYDPYLRLLVLVAGRIGERLAPAWDERFTALSASDDQRAIDSALGELGWASAAPAEHEADLLLLDHRRGFRRLARALAERRALDGAEVAAIVGR